MSPLVLFLMASASSGALVDEIQGPECAPDWYSTTGLAALLETDTASRALDAVALEVADCDAAPDMLTVRVFRTGELYPIDRQVDLAGIVSAIRLRTLALAVIECATAATPAELAASTATNAAAPGPPHPGAHLPKTPTQPQIALGSNVEGALAMRFSPKHGTVLLGARLAASVPIGAIWALTFDAGVEGGARTTRIGDVRLALASARAAAPLMLDGRRFAIGLGPSFEAGWVWTSGHANAESIAAGAKGALLFVVGAAVVMRVKVSDGLSLNARADLGGTVRGLEALVDGTPQAGVAGLLVGVQVGIGLAI